MFSESSAPPFYYIALSTGLSLWQLSRICYQTREEREKKKKKLPEDCQVTQFASVEINPKCKNPTHRNLHFNYYSKLLHLNEQSRQFDILTSYIMLLKSTKQVVAVR